MQAVVLAAGKGTRMRPLTLDCPKPLLEIGGIPIIEHIANALPEEITEIIVVIGYLGEMIKARYPETMAGRPVTYVDQPQGEGIGTALALVSTKSLLSGRFMVVLGDDLHSPLGFKEALTHESAIVAYKHENPSLFGVIALNADGTLDTLVEKPEFPPTDLISTGAMVLDESIFTYPMVLHEKGEYFIPDMVTPYAKDVPVHVVVTPFWMPIGTSEDLARANTLWAEGAILF